MSRPPAMYRGPKLGRSSQVEDHADRSVQLRAEPTAAIRIRERLQAAKADGVPFMDAWREALEDPDLDREWRRALVATCHEWEAAFYDRRRGVGRAMAHAIVEVEAA